MFVFIGIRFARDGPSMYAAFNVRYYPTFLGTAIVSYEGNATIMLVYGVMRNRNHGKKVVIFIYFAMTLLYILVAMAGSLAFRTSTTTIEILHLNPGLVRSLICTVYFVVVVLTFHFRFW